MNTGGGSVSRFACGDAAWTRDRSTEIGLSLHGWGRCSFSWHAPDAGPQEVAHSPRSVWEHPHSRREPPWPSEHKTTPPCNNMFTEKVNRQSQEARGLEKKRGMLS